MPDNSLPDAKTQQKAEPAEFNFSDPTTEAPRIRRRSLKSKQAGLVKAPETVPSIARELEKEAPPLPDEEPQTKPVATPTQPPKAAPSINTADATRPTASTSVTASSASSTPATSSPPKSVPITGHISPHPTRPATLYYSSQPRKEKEATPASAPAPMKTIPTASTTSTTSTQPNATARPATAATAATQPSTARPATASTATTVPTSVTRPAAAAASRPASTSDYRANIERQKSEQKSVGSILSYVVYGMIAFFVIAAALAGYGGYVLSQRISDQSVTVGQLDSKYSAANKDLQAKLAAAQETLTQAQAQIARQGDLINKQQDKMNQLITALNDNTKAITAEKQARIQETNGLRARVRDLENEKPAPTTR